jgi:hypothetical protein
VFEMKPVLLLTRAFVRQNRWLLLAFALWPFVLGAFVWSPNGNTSRTDVAEIVQQEVLYGIAVIAFLASSAIYNERRSRRIMVVLSKAVSRSRYLLGLLFGAVFFAIVYFGAVSVSLLWIADWSITAMSGAATLFVRGVTVSIWTASLALLFSTFLYPFVAASLAAIATFVPMFFRRNSLLAPATALIANIRPFSLDLPWVSFFVALAQSAIFLILAAQIFARRDVTASVE